MYASHNPGASQQQVLRNVLKHSQAALHTANNGHRVCWQLSGLPYLFLLLTADEASGMCWAEVIDLRPCYASMTASPLVMLLGAVLPISFLAAKISLWITSALLDSLLAASKAMPSGMRYGTMVVCMHTLSYGLGAGREPSSCSLALRSSHCQHAVFTTVGFVLDCFAQSHDVMSTMFIAYRMSTMKEDIYVETVDLSCCLAYVSCSVNRDMGVRQ